MTVNRIQFQPGMSLSQFLELYGTEEQCEAALEQTRWPDGFRCHRCGEQVCGLVYGRRQRRYQCRSCRHQTTVTAPTARKDVTPLNRKPGGLMEQSNASLQRGDQG